MTTYLTPPPPVRSPRLRRAVTVTALLVIAAALFLAVLAASSRADAAPGPEFIPTRPGVHVAETEPAGRRALVVEFTNGARQTVRPCAYEDGAGCWWDAARMGNHTGHSFVAVVRAGRVCVAYLDTDYAAGHDHCGEDSYADHDGAGE